MQLAVAISTFRRWAFPAPPESAVARAGGSRVPGQRVHESRVAARESSARRINAHAEIVTFVAWMREHDFLDRYDSANILEFYRWFASETGAPELPRLRVLTALGEHVAVKRTRERLKDARGKVIKLPTGTPARAVFYRILAAPVVAPTQEPCNAGAVAPAAPESEVPHQSRVHEPMPLAEAA
jgi:hypothetical protein